MGSDIELISARGTEEGFETFLLRLPVWIAAPRRSVQSELLELHQIVTGPCIKADIESFQRQLERQAVLNDRRDARSLLGALRQRLGRPPLPAEMQAELTSGVSVHLDVSLVGSLRSLGIRQVEDGPPHEVFAATHQGFEEGTISGLTLDLRGVFSAFARTYDRLIAERDNRWIPLPEKLRAVIFGQLWGARLLCPFWDGNRRVFMALLVLELNRLGFDVRDRVSFPEFGESSTAFTEGALDSLADEFLREVYLREMQLGFLDDQHVERLTYDPAFRDGYMRIYRDGFMKGLNRGLSQGPLSELYDKGVLILLTWLNRQGLIPGELYATATTAGGSWAVPTNVDAAVPFPAATYEFQADTTEAPSSPTAEEQTVIVSLESTCDVGWAEYSSTGYFLPPPEISVSSGLEQLGRFLSGAGRRFLLRTLTAAGAVLADNGPIHVSLDYCNFGLWSGIFFVRQHDEEGHRVTAALNLALDTRVRSQLVWEDFVLLGQIREIVGDRALPVYERVMAPFEQGQFALFSSRASTNFYEINCLGGAMVRGEQVLAQPQQILLNGIATERDNRVLSPKETKGLMERMLRIVVDIYLRSNEALLVLPLINSGDFILEANQGDGDAATGDGAGLVRLITARANMISQEDIYASFPNADPLGHLDAVPHPCPPRLRFVLSLLMRYEVWLQMTAETRQELTQAPAPEVVLEALLSGLQDASTALGSDPDEHTREWLNPVLEQLKEFSVRFGETDMFGRDTWARYSQFRIEAFLDSARAALTESRHPV